MSLFQGHLVLLTLVSINIAFPSNKMNGAITTHVLDTSKGRPAASLSIQLFRLNGDERVHVRTTTTNDDGRTDAPILPSEEFSLGTYELLFHAGDYLGNNSDITLGDPKFLDVIPIRFGVNEHKHYHVPLLLSPFGYSTYRGS